MDSWRRTCSLLVLCGFLMLQLVCGTTVIPLCKPGDPAENCTIAMVQTDDSPRVAPVKIIRCRTEMENFCFNGQCMYLVDLDEHSCRCNKGFTGDRCVHPEFVKKPTSQEYLALTIFLTLLLLLAIAVASFFAYKWYKNKKLSQPQKEYTEVNAQNV
ncbi:hypothetical protein FKM82_001433 [Ascaphus truei]